MANVHVNLLFEANTARAKNEVNELGSLLAKIGTTTKIGIDNGPIEQARSAARDLAIHLQKAVDVNTGKLNISQFNQSLKQGNTNLKTLANSLIGAGVQGQQAFTRLAQSILQAEAPAIKLNQTITQMFKQMGTAAMWTVAYGAIDAMTGAFKGAIDYAKDLNKALTDISIVSNLSEQQLATFAQTASKTAKELKTTTTAYTKAALIFYQQGLNSKEVQERTNAVIKMAQVTGESAQTVSDQMTAVWNNFDNGSRSLEYYVDVLTALGAVTASSTSEITQGLEKFAAVAETVGLSYEYAATALATVTAQTRQSADVVGTAFKTLFSRIQDLELGNTLEDGVTLGQYSQALATIGVNAIDANGNLREMDDILNDMGSKWNTLTDAQKTATAQSVAGVRQYTQLIALMDNWDTFKLNLTVAEGAEGTLDAQYSKWAESAEAASQRVEESVNTIYSQILDDDVVIDITNSIADLVYTVSGLIDSFGGIGPVIITLIAIFSKQLLPIIESVGSKLIYNFNALTGRSDKELNRSKETIKTLIEEKEKKGQISKATGEVLSKERELSDMSDKLAQKTKNMTAAQQEYAKSLFEMFKHSTKQVQDLAMMLDDLNKKIKENKKGIFGIRERANMRATFTEWQTSEDTSPEAQQRRILGAENIVKLNQGKVSELSFAGLNRENLQTTYGLSANVLDSLTLNSKAAGEDIAVSLENLEKLVKKYAEVTVVAEKAEAVFSELETRTGTPMSNDDFEAYKNKYEELAKQAGISADEIKMRLAKITPENLTKAFGDLHGELEVSAEGLGEVSYNLSDLIRQFGGNGQALDDWIDNMLKSEQTTEQQRVALKQLKKEKQELDRTLSKENGVTKVIGNLGRLAGSISMVVHSASMLVKALDFSEEMEPMERFMSVLSAFGMMIPVIAGIVGLIAQARELRSKTEKESFMLTLGRLILSKLIHKEEEKITKEMVKQQLVSPLATLIAIVGIIVTIALLINGATKLWNKQRDEMIKAQKEAEKLKQVYEEANEKQQQLIDNINSYEEGLNGLSKLVQGTSEYNDTLAKTNETAWELINTYDDLADKYQIVGGLVVFNKGALEDLEKAQSQERNRTQALSMAANQRAREAEEDYNIEQFARKNKNNNQVGTSEDWSNAMGWGAGGVGAGAVLGGAIAAIAGITLWPVLIAGAIIGGLTAGGIALFANKEEATDREISDIDKLAQEYERRGDSVFDPATAKALLGNDSPIVTALEHNADEVQKLVKEMHANRQQRRAELELYSANYLTATDPNWTRKTTEEQSAASKVMADWLEQYEQNSSKKTQADYVGGWFNTATSGSDALAKQYIEEVLGQEGVDLKNFKADGEIKYTYLDDNHQKQTAYLSYDELAEWEFQNNRENALNNGGRDQVLNFINSQRNQAGGLGLLEVINSDSLLNLTQEEYNTFLQEWNNGNVTKQLTEYAKIAGAEAANALAKQIEISLHEWDPAEALAAYQDKIRAEINTILSTGAEELEVDERALRSYADALMYTTDSLMQYTNGWEKANKEKAAAQLAVSLTKFTKGVKQLNTALQDNIEVFADWNDGSIETWEAVAEVQAALEQVFGVEVSGDFVKTYLNEIQELANGNVEVLKELSRLAARDYILNMDATQAGKNALNDILDTIFQIEDAANMDPITIETKLNDENTIRHLNNLLATGEITAEQVNAALGTIGYTPDIQYATTTTQSVMRIYEGEYDPNNQNATPTKTLVTENTVQIPYIAASNTANQTDLGGREVKGPPTVNGTGISYTGGTIDQKAKALEGLFNNNSRAEEKAFKAEIERYHEINEVLDDLSNAYDLIAEAKDRAFGPDKLKYMDMQIAKTKELLATQEQYLAEIEANLVLDRNAILKYGVSLDEHGRIDGYEQLMRTWISGRESGRISEETYDQFIADIEQYEETLNLWESQIIEKQSLIYQAIDESLEKVQIGVDYRLSLTEDALEAINFQLDLLDDSIEDSAQKILLLGQQMDQNMAKMNIYQEGIRQTFLAEGSGFNKEDVNAILGGDLSVLEGKTLTDAQIESLRDYRNSIIEVTQEAIDYQNSLPDTLIEGFESVNEELDKSIELLEHLTALGEGYRNIVDLLGVEAFGIDRKLLSDLSATTLALNMSSVAAQKAKLDQNRASMASLEAEILAVESKGGNAEALRQTLEEVKTTVQEDEQAILEVLATGLEAAAALFQQEMDNIVATFEDAMTGAYGSFEALQEGFNQQKELSELYLEDYKKIYELSKLNRDIIKSIDDNDSVVAKTKLRDLQEEINDLQNSNTKMSQYEVDALRAKYELRLAEIALEEAQRAKSQVRMTRDSEGNWGYVYTADEEAIEEATQNYEDKLYESQELTQNRIKELQEQLIAIPKEYSDAITAIYKEDLSPEEQARRISETDRIYREKYSYATQQLQLAMGHSSELYTQDWNAYSQATGYKISKNEEWIDSFEETILSQVTGFKTIEEAQSAFNENSSILLGQLAQKYEDYRKNVNLVFDAAGTDMENFLYDPATGVIKYMTDAKDTAEETSNEVAEIGKAGADTFETLVTEAGNWLVKYSPIIKGWKDENLELVNSINDIIAAYTGKDGLIEALDKLSSEYGYILGTTGVIPSEFDLAEGYVYSDYQTPVHVDETPYFSFNGQWYKQSDLGDSFEYDKKTNKYRVKRKDLDQAKSSATNETTVYQNERTGESTFDQTRWVRYNSSFLSDYAKKTPMVTVDSEMYYYQNGKWYNASSLEEVSNKKVYQNERTGELSFSDNKWSRASTSSLDAFASKEAEIKTSTSIKSLNGYVIPENIPLYYGSGYNSASGQITKVAPYDFESEWSLTKESQSVKEDEYRIFDVNGTKFLYIYGQRDANFGDMHIDDVAILYKLSDLFPAVFDTGGYTGSWDSSGRIAMLHQKELVLNADDTVNFLNAVNIVREIAQAIDLKAVSQAMSMANLRAASVNPNAQVVEQDVTIHAEFPNATNRTEIEEAFDSLLNRASQFANRKK